MPFYAFLNHFYGLIFEIALRINPLSFLSITHERTTQNANFAVCSSIFALFLISLSRSGNQGSLESKER